MKLTDGLAAAENTDSVKSMVDERYRLITSNNELVGQVYSSLILRLPGNGPHACGVREQPR